MLVGVLSVPANSVHRDSTVPVNSESFVVPHSVSSALYFSIVNNPMSVYDINTDHIKTYSFMDCVMAQAVSH